MVPRCRVFSVVAPVLLCFLPLAPSLPPSLCSPCTRFQFTRPCTHYNIRTHRRLLSGAARYLWAGRAATARWAGARMPWRPASAACLPLYAAARSLS